MFRSCSDWAETMRDHSLPIMGEKDSRLSSCTMEVTPDRIQSEKPFIAADCHLVAAENLALAGNHSGNIFKNEVAIAS